MTVSDILAQFGIPSDTDAGKNLPAPEGAMQPAAHPVLVLESVMLALEEPFLRIQTIAEAAIAQIDTLIRAAAGKPTGRMDAWLAAAERHHVPFAEVTRAIENIQTATEELYAGGGNRKPWESLGIFPAQDPFDVLEQVRDRMATLAPAIARSALAEAGIGSGMFRLLQQQELDLSGTGSGYPAYQQHDSLSNFAQNLMAEVRNATTWVSGILSGFRDAVVESFPIEDSMEAWSRGVLGNTQAKESLARLDDALREIAEPIGDTLQFSSSLVDNAGNNDLTALMSWLAPATTLDVSSAIPASFLSQPSPTFALRTVSDDPATPPPNTTINVNQYIEGTTEPQKAAEDAIRSMLEMTAAQLPAENY